MKFNTAFAARDHSHCARSLCQSAVIIVQLLVAWLATEGRSVHTQRHSTNTTFGG